jgi:YbbR domain-containing protein
VGGEPVSLPVQLESVDDGVQITDYGPKTVNVQVDPVVTRELTVTVDSGQIPEGLDVGPAQADPPTVVLRGASTRIASVTTATARVAVDASALNVDQEVEVVPLDESGTLVTGVDVTPPRVRVRIEVARQISTATLPVAPQLSGEIDQGYQLGPVIVEPLTVSVSGEAPAVEQLSSVPTAPIELGGRTGSIELEVDLAPPPEVTVNGPESVKVTLKIVPAFGSRTYETGLTLAGARPDLTYALSTPSVLVNLAGTVPVLDSIDGSEIQAVVDVTDLGPGRRELVLRVEAPADIEVVAVAPESIIVDIVALPQEPSPAPATDSLLPSP